MPGYQTVLFDLDGTITNSGAGITNGVVYALAKYGIEVRDKTELFCFIGPPLAESFMRYYGLSPEQAKEAIGFYREYYRDTGIFENTIYDGIESLLRNLRAHEKTLVLATSKPEVFARQILAHYGLDGYFLFIAGADLDGQRVNKADVIAYALASAGIAAGKDVVMCGDREHDVLGAQAHGLDSIGVLFGYGDRAELEQAGATHIAPTPADIEPIVLGI